MKNLTYLDVSGNLKLNVIPHSIVGLQKVRIFMSIGLSIFVVVTIMTISIIMYYCVLLLCIIIIIIMYYSITLFNLYIYYIIFSWKPFSVQAAQSPLYHPHFVI